MAETMEFPFSASFRLFRPDGLNILFTVRGSEPAQHITDLAGYLGHLETAGYLVDMPGAEPGEKIEEVDAWVLGETSDGHPCVYLYAANHALKWRVATVYVEKLQELPFVVGGVAAWPGSAPERDVAEKKKYLHTCDPFKIVMKPTGKQTEAGNDVLKFDRVLDAKPAVQNGTKPLPPPVAFKTKPPVTNGKPAASGLPFHNAMASDIPIFATPAEVARVMGLLGLKYPGTKDEAAGTKVLLEAFAALRADGVEESLAVIHVTDGVTAGK